MFSIHRTLSDKLKELKNVIKSDVVISNVFCGMFDSYCHHMPPYIHTL